MTSDANMTSDVTKNSAASATTELDQLLLDVRACTLCAPHLPHGVRPVLQMGMGARILIVGQAPGRKVHESGVPFNDVSGDRLRVWLGVDRDTFYDAGRIALLPMGFCFPGTLRGVPGAPQGSSRGGDLPPRPECAVTWRARLLAHLHQVQLTVVLGRYALNWHMRDEQRTAGESSVTALVQNWRRYAPEKFVLPHPSPRNQHWVRRNAWFEAELLPALRARVAQVLTD